jgi:hypothetical protein
VIPLIRAAIRGERSTCAVREYLAALDAADNDEKIGGDDNGSNRGGKRRKPPKEVSLTDPQAAWVARKNTDPFFAYDANYLIDNKAGIIVDAEGTRANRIAEIAITETMIERVKNRFDLQPRRLAGDTVYGAVRLLGTLRWHLQPGRVRVRPIAQHLHLPRGKAAAHHRNSHRWSYASLSRLEARLRCLRIQNAVLPPCAFAVDSSRFS